MKRKAKHASLEALDLKGCFDPKPILLRLSVPLIPGRGFRIYDYQKDIPKIREVTRKEASNTLLLAHCAGLYTIALDDNLSNEDELIIAIELKETA